MVAKINTLTGEITPSFPLPIIKSGIHPSRVFNLLNCVLCCIMIVVD